MEAPLVSLEEEFEEGPGDDGGTPQRAADPALAELESFSAEMMSFKSMEDLVQEFDEKLTVCFRNYDAATEGLAPVRGRLQAQEEEERLQDEEPPSLCLLQLCEKEEEELTERSEQDSGINEEPLLTAEQVIEELEELMQSSPDPEEEDEETEADAEGKGSGGGTEPILLRELRAFSPAFNNNCSHEGMHFSGRACVFLIALVPIRDWTGRVTGCVAAYRTGRGQVVSPVAPGLPINHPHRIPDSLRLEKPLGIIESNPQQFCAIWVVFGVGGVFFFQYLNTVIPYEKKGSPPSVEDLQMLTNILFAMKEGNEKVPTLLTDYILKVLVPTPMVFTCLN
uniref:Fasciculation and elongation protein zeta 1 n=1 Tax=Otus sunia TaxID=257818 RepID=A0A8C8BIK2_9STRI